MQPLIIIPRWEPYKARDGSKQWAPMVAIYDAEAAYSWRLSCYSPDEGHGPLNPDYYRNTRPAKNGDAAAKLAASYVADLTPGTYKLARRLPARWAY